jgi:predicted MFS family arabinose efflux permease
VDLLRQHPVGSTAVGVVKPDHAGTASGINATFRQIGVAVAVAVLGAIFDSRISATSRPAAGEYAS